MSQQVEAPRVYVTPEGGMLHWCLWCGACVEGFGLTLFTMAVAEHYAFRHMDRTWDEVQQAVESLTGGGSGLTQ